MTKTFTFTIGERLATLKIFDQFKGSITALASVMDDIKLFAVTSAEWEKAGREIIKGTDKEGKPTESWKWNEEDESTRKEIAISQEGLEYLRKFIKDQSDKGEITLADVNLIGLNNKIA